MRSAGVSGQLFVDLPAPRASRAVCARFRATLRQPEGRSAQWWCSAMMTATDTARKAQCRAMMVAALVALDHGWPRQ